MEKMGIVMVMLMVVGVQMVAAKTFKVGGSGGWDLSGGDFQSWADTNTYHVGDSLGFVYEGPHSVVETDAAGFKACSSANAIKDDSSGNSVIELKSAGKHYFICGIQGHCTQGMKFSVDALPASPSSTSPSTTKTDPKANDESSSDSWASKTSTLFFTLALVLSFYFFVLV